MAAHLFWWQMPFDWGFEACAAAWGGGGRWSWPILSWPLRRFPKSPGGGGHSAYPAIMGSLTSRIRLTPKFWCYLVDFDAQLWSWDAPELESTSSSSFYGGMWFSEPMMMSPHLTLVSGIWPACPCTHKSCQELLTFCVLLVTLRLLLPSGLDRSQGGWCWLWDPAEQVFRVKQVKRGLSQV